MSNLQLLFGSPGNRRAGGRVRDQREEGEGSAEKGRGVRDKRERTSVTRKEQLHLVSLLTDLRNRQFSRCTNS